MVTDPVAVTLVAGATSANTGGVLSTTTTALGPAPVSGVPPILVEVPATIVMPRVPDPVIPERVAVRLLPVPPIVTVDALADPVRFTVTLAGNKLMALAPE